MAAAQSGTGSDRVTDQTGARLSGLTIDLNLESASTQGELHSP